MDSGNCVLVTGASGFIGRRLVEMLVARGARVKMASSDPARLASISLPSVDIVKADLGDHAALSAACAGCDTIVHVAYKFGGSAREQRRANIDGTIALAEAALRSRVRRFVHFSSVAAYGTPRDGDLIETMPPKPSSDLYCEIKQTIERKLLDLHATRGLPVAILQPTIVYGPRGGFWTTSLLDQVQTKRMVLPRSGLGLCNAVYVDDVASAVILACEHDAAIGETFLVSGAAPVTWLDFYRAYAAMAGTASVATLDDAAFDAAYSRRYGSIRPLQRYRRGIERILSRIDKKARPDLPDPGTRVLYGARTHVQIGKARATIGFEPAFDLSRGMAATKDWAKQAGLIGSGE